MVKMTNVKNKILVPALLTCAAVFHMTSASYASSDTHVSKIEQAIEETLRELQVHSLEIATKAIKAALTQLQETEKTLEFSLNDARENLLTLKEELGNSGLSKNEIKHVLKDIKEAQEQAEFETKEALKEVRKALIELKSEEI